MYRLLWASNWSCIANGNVDHFLSLLCILLIFLAFENVLRSFFFLNCILKFSFRTDLVQMKFLNVYLFSVFISPSSLRGPFADCQIWVDSWFLTGLSRYYWTVGLCSCHWTICNHSVIFFNWHILFCWPFKVLSSPSVFTSSIAMCIGWNFL